MNIVKTMDRIVNLTPFSILSQVNEIEHHTLLEITTIVIENSGNFFYIKDEVEKILDVSNMPQYIKEDWINYNKKELNIALLNHQIKNLENILEYKRPYDEKDEEALILLKSLRRDLIINGLI